MPLAMKVWYYLLSIAPAAVALRCFICGQIDPPVAEDGDCLSQFDYDCSYGLNQSSPPAEFLCKTTRYKLSEEQYSITKECISKQTYDQQFLFNSQSLYNTCNMNAFGLKDEEISYCVCNSHDLCNSASILKQSLLANVIQAQTPAVNQLQSNARFYGIQNNQLPVLNSIESATSNAYPTLLSCYTCTESNLAGPRDCQTQRQISCDAESGRNMFCLTIFQRLVPSDLYSVDKRCITDQDREYLQQLSGNPVSINGCSRTSSGNVAYCYCSENFCNLNISAFFLTSSTTVPTLDIVLTSNSPRISENNPTRPHAFNRSRSFFEQSFRPHLNRNAVDIFAPDPWTKKARLQYRIAERNSEQYFGTACRQVPTLFVIIILFLESFVRII